MKNSTRIKQSKLSALEKNILCVIHSGTDASGYYDWSRRKAFHGQPVNDLKKCLTRRSSGFRFFESERPAVSLALKRLALRGLVFRFDKHLKLILGDHKKTQFVRITPRGEEIVKRLTSVALLKNWRQDELENMLVSPLFHRIGEIVIQDDERAKRRHDTE